MKNTIINNPKLGFSSIVKEKIEEWFPFLFERCILPKLTQKHDKRLEPLIRDFINEVISKKPLPFFTKIEIETINRCNNICVFCPVNKNIDKRPFKIMELKLFNSIIEQLKELDYSGSISLFSNNEPLLDKRIIELCKITKEALPKAFLYLYTNGLLLTVDKLEALMKYLDKLIIDNYNDKRELIKPVREIYEYCSGKNIYFDKLEIFMRKQNEHLTTRAGQAQNRSRIKPLKSLCIYPFCQFVIRPDGKVSLCCNDALGKMTMGNLTAERIVDVWNGDKYKDVRKRLLNGRRYVDLCYSCDFIAIPGDSPLGGEIR